MTFTDLKHTLKVTKTLCYENYYVHLSVYLCGCPSRSCAVYAAVILSVSPSVTLVSCVKTAE